MTADLNRRTLLAGTAAAAMPEIAAFVRPARAVSDENGAIPHSDADLIELAALFFAALAKRDQYDRDAEDALERCRHVKIPDALLFREGDGGVCSFRELTRFWVGEDWRKAFEGGVADLNNYAKRYAREGEECGISTAFFGSAARERTREIAEAHAVWADEIAQAEAECGFTGLSEAAGRETNLMADLRRRIISCPACTLEGLILKARIASLDLSSDPGWIEHTLLPRLLEAPGTVWSSDDPMLVSLVVDALRIGASSPVCTGRLA